MSLFFREFDVAPDRRPRQLSLGVAVLCFVLVCRSNSHADNPKRGWADTTPTVSELGATNVGWFYRWGLNRPSGNYDANFVPMFWGGGSVTTQNINQVISDGNITHVLGFNEPESSSQANMSVATAITKWQTLQDGFSGTGIDLVSPGVSDNAAGQQWLADFMTEVDNQGLQVDAIAFHWYGVDNPNNPVGAANQLLNRVDSYHNTYGRPIWLTEFAIHDWGNNYTDEEIRTANEIFLEHVIPGLESRSYVEKFAFYNWFSDSALIEGDPLAPTIVGDPYVGTIKNGDTFDINGISYGNDAFYLKGGEITNSGPAQADAMRFLDALEGTSQLSGVADWHIGNQGWVRVRTGATLRKTGANQIRWNETNVTNGGEIHVSAGTLQLEQNTIFTGGGLLRLDAGGTLSLGTAVDRSGVGLNQNLELRGGTVRANVIADGGHVLSASATVYGTSVFSGDGVLFATGPLLAPAGGGGGGIIKEGTGTLYLTATNTYEGETVVKQGRLKLADTATLNNASLIRVQAGGTLDVTDFAAGYTPSGQNLKSAGQIDGSLHLTNGSTLTALGDNSVITGNLVSDHATIRIDAVESDPDIVSAGLQLNFDAAQDVAGDATWSNAAAPGTADNIAFSGNASSIAVADAAFPGIASAYDISSTGSAGGLNGYFELQGPARSKQDATFEVVFHVSSTTAGADQVLFEAGATRGVSLLLSDNVLSFNVDGDGSAISLSTDLTPGWHHAVGVVDLTGVDDDLANDSMELFVDNVSVASQTGVLIDDWAGGNISGVGGPASGVAGTATPVNYHGEIAVARYYNDLAFGAAEVTRNHQALLGPTQVVAPATLQVSGDFTQHAGSTLEMDLFPGLGNDLLTVAGTFTAGGDLQISLVGSDPLPGDTFQIFDATVFAGSFNNIQLPSLAGDLAWSTSSLLVTGVLEVISSVTPDFDMNGVIDGQDIDLLVMEVVSATNPALFDLTGDGAVDENDITAWLSQAGAANLASGNPYLVGDANLDGVVDVSDFNLWNAHKFTTTAQWTKGDFNADGFTDVSDFNLWNTNKFRSADDMRAVPEPASVMLMFVGFALLGMMRRLR